MSSRFSTVIPQKSGILKGLDWRSCHALLSKEIEGMQHRRVITNTVRRAKVMTCYLYGG